jgi:glutamyl-tRNA synthetase
MDLGYLRQNMTPEALIGKLAAGAGLIEKDEPISVKELATVFSWEKLKGEVIYCTEL